MGLHGPLTVTQKLCKISTLVNSTKFSRLGAFSVQQRYRPSENDGTGCRGYTHLPNAYHLEDAWGARLKSPLMQQIRVEEFYVELRRRFDTDKSGSPLDVEIFANAVNRTENLQQLLEIMEYGIHIASRHSARSLFDFSGMAFREDGDRKLNFFVVVGASLRLSKSSAKVREGIHHAVIRAHIQLELFDDLLKVLSDKPKYGLFLDQFIASLLMDKFLDMKRPDGATRIAIDLMLQEDFASLITRDLAIYSCLTFLEDPDWNTVRPPPPPEAALDSGEEVIIYVKHLKNPFFDDHFDLQEPKHLVGKTLYVAGMARTDLLGRSAQVHGLALQEKWEKGVSLLETLVQQGESLLLDEFQFFMDGLKAVPKTPEGVAASLPPSETPPIISVPGVEVARPLQVDAAIARLEEISRQMEAKGLLKDGKLLDKWEIELKESIFAFSGATIESQKALYNKWINDRETEVENQIRRFQLEERLKELKVKRDLLQSEEDHLFFFERKNEWENMLSPEARQRMTDEEKADGSSYDFRIQDPGYEIKQIPEAKTYVKYRWWEQPQSTFDTNQAEQGRKYQVGRGWK